MNLTQKVVMKATAAIMTLAALSIAAPICAQWLSYLSTESI
jgi:hypothetical protein